MSTRVLCRLSSPAAGCSNRPIPGREWERNLPPARIHESLAILSAYFRTERGWVYNYHPRTKKHHCGHPTMKRCPQPDTGGTSLVGLLNPLFENNALKRIIPYIDVVVRPGPLHRNILVWSNFHEQLGLFQQILTPMSLDFSLYFSW